LVDAVGDRRTVQTTPSARTVKAIAEEVDMPVDELNWSASARSAAIRHAVGRATRAPSVHNSQPWRFLVDGDTVSVRADRSRQVLAIDPRGRELVMSIGAALLNLRVGLAARAWAADVRRLPDRDDPDLMAVVRVVPGRPETALARLDPTITVRRTNRRRFRPEQPPEDLLLRLSAASAEDQTLVIPVRSPDHRRLVSRLTRQADQWQNGDPAYRAEIRRWTSRPTSSGDGIPTTVVPRVDGRSPTSDPPLRDFDASGSAELPADLGGPDRRGEEPTLLLLTTLTDGPEAWLRAGEAMERVLLELTQAGWVASPVTQAVEVPVTRSQLRTALCWGAHPQILLRIGRAAPVPKTPRRRHIEVVTGADMSPARLPNHPVTPSPTGRTSPDPRPVSDGRGGTTWT
jgi:nitroreductase